GRIRRVGERSAPRISARRGITLGGLPRGACRRAGAGTPGRRPGERTRLHHHVPRPLGRRDRAAKREFQKVRSRTASMHRFGGFPRWSDAMIRDVVEVRPLGAHRSFDCLFEPLRDPARFAEVQVNADLGTICWPNEADLAPEVLYAKITTGPQLSV